MIHRPLTIVLLVCGCGMSAATPLFAVDFNGDVKPLLNKYCNSCHSGDEAHGDVDFSVIESSDDVSQNFELWETVVEHLNGGTMPPEDELQPSTAERSKVILWYQSFITSVESQPAVHSPRRLSATEYRNTLSTVLGFDLEVAVIEAEQTVAERSMVLKLLPTDPPGQSGFKNDTHQNPLTTNSWDQYSYIANAAVERLFSPVDPTCLEALCGPISKSNLSIQQTETLLRSFLSLTTRRPVSDRRVTEVLNRLKTKSGTELVDAVKLELRSALTAPEFLYRGLKHSGIPGQRQPVDDFELAERLSYFLWADMPDERLFRLAESGRLNAPNMIAAEVERMLASPKARRLADVFATEWLTLNEIEHVSDNVPKMVALKSQPLDFMHYLFTQNRPLLELINSTTTFISPHTASLYGADSKQMTRYVKQRGIEVEIVPNQKIQIKQATERGGILTMPGILAMNRGPILRGTWILERILGDELPEPPANVGQVPPNNSRKTLTFRERFEQHRSNPTCALCHDKIDPLGFALQSYGDQGQYLLKPSQQKKRKQKEPAPVKTIDTSGRLPSGESFADFAELKKILTTTQREAVLRNMIERTMSYALCRKLVIYDRPTVDKVTERMIATNGTWQELFVTIANSVPFQETILPEAN